MLNDYINAYIKARKNNNAKVMVKIEKSLARLGMDKMSLQVVADEIEREGRAESYS